MLNRLCGGVILWLLAHGCLLAGDEPHITLVVSGSLRGRVEGCHCPGGFTGGLARRAEALNRLFPKNIPPGIDCGGILDLDPEGGKAASRCAVLGLAGQGLRVLGAAPRDLFYGIPYLQSLTDSVGIQLVSANLIEPASGKLIFNRWALINVNGFLTAITSLVDYQEGRRFTAPIGWTRCPPDSVLDELVKTKPENAAFLILLTDMGRENLQKFLSHSPIYFDLVVTSNRHFDVDQPSVIDGILVVRPAQDGNALNHVVLHSGTLPEFITTPLPEKARKDQSTVVWVDKCLGRNVPEK